MMKLYNVYEQWDEKGRTHVDENGRPKLVFVGRAASFEDAKHLTRFPIMEASE